jgi:hypothetical protein
LQDLDLELFREPFLGHSYGKHFPRATAQKVAILTASLSLVFGKLNPKAKEADGPLFSQRTIDCAAAQLASL